jgi:hypothetical protein
LNEFTLILVEIKEAQAIERLDGFVQIGFIGDGPAVSDVIEHFGGRTGWLVRLQLKDCRKICWFHGADLPDSQVREITP